MLAGAPIHANLICRRVMQLAQGTWVSEFHQVRIHPHRNKPDARATGRLRRRIDPRPVGPGSSRRHRATGCGRGKSSWRSGFSWGLGHTGGVWLVGLLAVLLRDSLPLEGLSAWSARVVGVMLIGIGILHGLAGSSHFFGVLPALGLPDRTSALSYLLAFGAGSIPAMSLFAGFIGGLTLRFAGAAPVLHRGILGLCSFAAICVGGWWLSQ